MTGKSTIFFTFHTTSSALSIIFVDGNSKSNTGTSIVNLTSSLTLTDINYVPHVLFNFVSVGHLTKALNCSIIIPSLCTFSDLQTKKVIGWGMSKMVYIIFNAVINLK